MNPESDDDPHGPEPSSARSADFHRMFLHEPGWQVALKVGSVREFCYVIAPGDDHYHRLLDGEIFLFSSEERICCACAERRGLLSREPKRLREPLVPIEFDSRPDGLGSVFELRRREEE
jgi:hypothetical protein